MRAYRWFSLAVLIALVFSLTNVVPATANPPAPEDRAEPTFEELRSYPSRGATSSKTIDQPNKLDYDRLRERQRLLESGDLIGAMAQSTVANDRVLVILVEFAGSDTFTWDPAVSTWDPMNVADPAEDAGAVGDCSLVTGIPAVPTDFTYGPTLHNTLPRPVSEADASGTSIWTEDFSPDWFKSFMFGNGVTINYNRVDGSPVNVDFTGKSVKNYYLDMSDGKYNITGDVIGWLQVPHSEMWYGADACPGARSSSGGYSISNSGAIPEAGTARSLVKDALGLVEAERLAGHLGDFDWANYDLNGDKVIDRLWIVHSGYGEEDNTTLLNRTDYGEGSLWSHSSAITPDYPIGSTGYAAGPYIMMPENGGIGVFAHEYGHNLGATDLYAYGFGETSAGFWTLMADDWTGFPIGFQPPAVDPWHLDLWGWLNPKVISDATQEYTVKIGQASEFPGGSDVYRGVKIELPDGIAPLPVTPNTGDYQWWGGKIDLNNAMMTLKTPIAVPKAPATTALQFALAYDIEDVWDFLWVQASTDGGTTWETVTNDDMICAHAPEWIGSLYGFPEDLCGAGIAGFSGYNAEFPGYGQQAIDLTPFAGEEILLRFWYMTDWATSYSGAFVDDVRVTSGATTLFSDGAEAGNANWTYESGWERNNGNQTFTHNLYLQWRNVSATGGYDSALGDPRWRYGPANSGLLVWYNNNFYTDNEVWNYLFDWPGFGPKGVMLVNDAHPDPYRDPAMVAMGYDNEGGNLPSRMQMRDAPFSLGDTVDFSYKGTAYAGRPAVSAFHDSYNYYPGAELVSRGPAYPPSDKQWVTKQWDASMTAPATAEVGINAPGYLGDGPIRFYCSPILSGANTGKLSCYWNPYGLGYDGGTGAPGDVAAQYGWHVQILEQTDKTATLRIWNAMNDLDDTFAPDKTVSKMNDIVTYTYTLRENIGTAASLFTCVPIDTDKETFVYGSATGGAVPLPMTCPEVAEAASKGLTDLNRLSASAIDPAFYKSVAWVADVPTSNGGSFSYQVKVKLLTGILDAPLDIFNFGVYWQTLLADPVKILADFIYHLPVIWK